jgi:hypothetical protein
MLYMVIVCIQYVQSNSQSRPSTPDYALFLVASAPESECESESYVTIDDQWATLVLE